MLLSLFVRIDRGLEKLCDATKESRREKIRLISNENEEDRERERALGKFWCCHYTVRPSLIYYVSFAERREKKIL